MCDSATSALQLHVYGLAFHLPSIDAECIAAVALLKLVHDPNSWSITPSHDVYAVPSQCFPALKDGESWYTGFDAISKHLSPSTDLSSQQRADCIAIHSFIESSARPLLDLSLYVSFENYRLTTRPAFTAILPWHANYILPPSLRAAARKRTEHLNIRSIDLDTVHDDPLDRPRGLELDTDLGKEKKEGNEVEKRASLLLPRKLTVRSMLQRPEHAAVFRLNALADAFFDPLQRMLGGNTYLLGTEIPSAVDCLAYGYLSLMLFPQVPQAWLRERMESKYKTLVQYTRNLEKILDLGTNAPDIMALSDCQTPADFVRAREEKNITLPFQPAQPSSFFSTSASIARDIYTRTPLPALFQPGPGSESVFRRFLPQFLTFATTSVALLGYWTYHDFAWSRGEEVQIFGKKRLSDLGEAGGLFAALGGLHHGYGDESASGFGRERVGPVDVDVDVNVEAIGGGEL
ncbi:hypothetical protein LTR66_013502 [Elasticomyces elasticus]|nr:hypothetical protein LTR66_013502 [Elasticomyces elasticus]KAK5007717.1 hypothetical protein LTR28_004928 [Elasticomyces elasticus]